MRSVLAGALVVAIGIAGCGTATTRTVTVTQTTVRTVVERSTTAALAAPKPLATPELFDGTGTYIEWIGHGAGEAAAYFQRNSAKLGTYWSEATYTGEASLLQPICQLRADGLIAEVWDYNESDAATANSTCADLVTHGWHQ